MTETASQNGRGNNPSPSPPKMSAVGNGTPDVQVERRVLDAIAEMAAGAAHELNNPLTVISGRAQLMQEKAETPQQQKAWGLIAAQAHQISDILADLMRFASPNPPHPERISVRKLLKHTITSFSSSNPLNSGVAQFDRKIAGRVPDVWADRAQVQTVMRQLVENAINTARSKPYILLSAQADSGGKQVLLKVQDNGPGMEPKTLASAFVPFFSSQAAGRRRGLGLPMAWRYVVENHGKIWLESQPGKGTTALVLLPAAE